MASAAVCMAMHAAEAVPSFTRDVAPILVAKCLACHNAEKAKGGYRLHTFEALLKPGDSKEPPIVAGKPDDSLLFKLLVTGNEDDRMPQKDEALPAADISSIRRWILAGAKLDGTNVATSLILLAPHVHPPAPKTYAVPIPVTALAFDSSGEILAVSGYHEVTLWNSRSGQLLRRIGNVPERTFDLAFSPDGRWLAFAGGTPGRIGESRLFNTTNGAPGPLLTTSIDAQLCVAFSPDGQLLATGGADNVIRIWDVKTAAQRHQIEQHADWVLNVAFSPDNKHLASGSRDKSARVFNVATGELETTHTGHGEFVTAVAWADAKSVISASRERTAHRWNASDARTTARFSGWDAAPSRIVVASNSLFSACMDGEVREHHIAEKKLAHTFSGSADVVHALALHSASRRLAAGSHDGVVRVWNVDDGTRLLEFTAAPGFEKKESRLP